MKKTNLTAFVKTLRKNSTDCERKLWRYLRAHQFQDLKFRRQEQIGHYIVDFVCYDKKVIIELDGGQHSVPEQREKDEMRDSWLRSQGFSVLRFWDSDVLTNIEGVLEKIRETCEKHPPLRPLP
jgi:very-short-patch-repair endonuclease